MDHDLSISQNESISFWPALSINKVIILHRQKPVVNSLSCFTSLFNIFKTEVRVLGGLIELDHNVLVHTLWAVV